MSQQTPTHISPDVRCDSCMLYRGRRIRCYKRAYTTLFLPDPFTATRTEYRTCPLHNSPETFLHRRRPRP